MSVDHRAAAVAAPGTDPSVLAHVVGGLARPRHGPGRLLAACRDVDDPCEVPAAMAAVVGALDASERAAAGRLLAAWQDAGVRVALLGDAGYPHRLVAPWPSVAPPVLLAWRGQPPSDSPAVAIVGARNASTYGADVAAWIADAVGAAGARVVSGGAVGVDAAAHHASLASPGGTTVVLGCGHQVSYPRPHARTGGLFDQVVASAGTVCSELLPYEPPRPGAVRARNRVVAGLADVVVVVEGGTHSGSLLTASAAAEWGRTVLAVPGDVRAPGSQAPHRLLAEGAAPCTGPADVLDALGAEAAPTVNESARADELAADGPLRVIADAWPRAIPLDELAARADRPVGEVLAIVGRAELDGRVVRDGHAVRLVRSSGDTTHGS